MDAPQDEFLATLANFLSVHVLLKELVVVSHSVHVLAEVAEEVVEEEVECLQEVAVVFDLRDNLVTGHLLLDELLAIAFLQQLVDFQHVRRLGLALPRGNLLDRVLDELHAGELAVDLNVAHEVLKRLVVLARAHASNVLLCVPELPLELVLIQLARLAEHVVLDEGLVLGAHGLDLVRLEQVVAPDEALEDALALLRQVEQERLEVSDLTVLVAQRPQD